MKKKDAPKKAKPLEQHEIENQVADICKKDLGGLLDEHLPRVFKDIERQFADGVDPCMAVQFVMELSVERDPRRVEVKTDLVWATRVKRTIDGFGGSVNVEPDLFTGLEPEAPKQINKPRKQLGPAVIDA